MRPAGHIIVAIGLGYCVFHITNNLLLAVISALAEVLIDVDHIIDHLIWSRHPFCLQAFLSLENLFTWPRVIFLLHSYEFILLLAVFAWYFDILFLQYIVLGLIVHMFLDEVVNRLPRWSHSISPGFYFFSYKLLRRFRTDLLTKYREVISQDKSTSI